MTNELDMMEPVVPTAPVGNKINVHNGAVAMQSS